MLLLLRQPSQGTLDDSCLIFRSRSLSPPRLHQLCGQMDGLPDAVVTAATARVRYPCINIRVGRIGPSLEQGKRAHDHAGLAVAALRRIEFLPGDLNRMGAIRRDSFDSGNFLADGRSRADAAGTDRLTIDVHRACAALPDAAAELRSCQADMITDHPQQWRLRVGIDGMSHAIHIQIDRHTRLPSLESRNCSRRLWGCG